MMPLTLAEVGEENIIRKIGGEAGGQGSSGEPRFCCGRGGHGSQCHRGKCYREREGFPYCCEQRDGTENHGLSKNKMK